VCFAKAGRKQTKKQTKKQSKKQSKKQTNKQINKQPNNQTNNQTNKQTAWNRTHRLTNTLRSNGWEKRAVRRLHGVRDADARPVRRQCDPVEGATV
jgi:hypothetical protein